MKAEEEVDFVDKVHIGSKGTSNITSYRRNIENKRDIQYLFLSKKYFKQKGHPILLIIQEIFQTRGIFNITCYPRNISNKKDIQYLFLSKKYFKQEGHQIYLVVLQYQSRMTTEPVAISFGLARTVWSWRSGENEKNALFLRCKKYQHGRAPNLICFQADKRSTLLHPANQNIQEIENEKCSTSTFPNVLLRYIAFI